MRTVRFDWTVGGVDKQGSAIVEDDGTFQFTPYDIAAGSSVVVTVAAEAWAPLADCTWMSVSSDITYTQPAAPAAPTITLDGVLHGVYSTDHWISTDATIYGTVTRSGTAVSGDLVEIEVFSGETQLAKGTVQTDSLGRYQYTLPIPSGTNYSSLSFKTRVEECYSSLSSYTSDWTSPLYLELASSVGVAPSFDDLSLVSFTGTAGGVYRITNNPSLCGKLYAPYVPTGTHIVVGFDLDGHDATDTIDNYVPLDANNQFMFYPADLHPYTDGSLTLVTITAWIYTYDVTAGTYARVSGSSRSITFAWTPVVEAPAANIAFTTPSGGLHHYLQCGYGSHT